MRCRNLLDNRRRIKELYRGPGNHANLKNNHAAPPSATKKAPNDIENDFYSKFAEIVERRMSDSSLSIDSIASEMGLSQSQLTRKIKALTNYTPVEIIRIIRLRRAKTLLNSTDKTVSEIAFEVGFSSLAYFSKCYKESFGVSPSETRSKSE